MNPSLRASACAAAALLASSALAASARAGSPARPVLAEKLRLVRMALLQRDLRPYLSCDTVRDAGSGFSDGSSGLTSTTAFVFAVDPGRRGRLLGFQTMCSSRSFDFLERSHARGRARVLVEVSSFRTARGASQLFADIRRAEAALRRGPREHAFRVAGVPGAFGYAVTAADLAGRSVADTFVYVLRGRWLGIVEVTRFDGRYDARAAAAVAREQGARIAAVGDRRLGQRPPPDAQAQTLRAGDLQLGESLASQRRIREVAALSTFRRQFRFSALPALLVADARVFPTVEVAHNAGVRYNTYPSTQEAVFGAFRGLGMTGLRRLTGFAQRTLGVGDEGAVFSASARVVPTPAVKFGSIDFFLVTARVRRSVGQALIAAVHGTISAKTIRQVGRALAAALVRGGAEELQPLAA